MTSKLHDKLKRLHDSRVSALTKESRVVEADEAIETDAVDDRPIEPPQPTIPRSPSRFDGLIRAQRLEEKTKSSRVPATSSSSGESTSSVAPARTSQPNTIGARVKALRVEITSLEAGEPALRTLLYEMVALQPDNTFALSRLVQLHSERGEKEIAQLFADRLKSHSPF